MIIVHWLHSYWNWAGSNIGAMPACGALAVGFTLAFRKPVARAWHRLVGEHADIEDIRRAAEAAHRIAADMHEKLTGEVHPYAPAPDKESGGQ